MYVGRVFLCYESSTRWKKKRQRIVFVFMSSMCVLFFAVHVSCHTHEWVRAMPHIWMSACFICSTMHVTCMNKWVRVFMSHVWVRECVSSLWMRHVTHMKEEAPENVLQMNTSDNTKELRQDDRNVELCVLQCVAVCCNVLQCVAVCYSVLQSVAATLNERAEKR